MFACRPWANRAWSVCRGQASSWSITSVKCFCLGYGGGGRSNGKKGFSHNGGQKGKSSAPPPRRADNKNQRRPPRNDHGKSWKKFDVYDPTQDGFVAMSVDEADRRRLALKAFKLTFRDPPSHVCDKYMIVAVWSDLKF